ncbi:MAG TPA: PD-(D/E)XK nuclease family protein [Elusimicrobiales bacterium]|nr:PD-(D/E)XK nuclease family protein [Elusimicrobiales bacterium]
MGITVIAAGEDLVEKAGELLLSSGAPENGLVVFPGKRPGHFLRRYLAVRTGEALRSPRILSMDGFIDLIAGELGLSGAEASALDMAGALYSGLRKSAETAGACAPADLSLDAFLPWAFKLAGDFEELRIELKTGKDLAGVDALLPEDLRSAPFLRKMEGFSRLYGSFYSELAGRRLITRSSKYAAAAERISDFDHRPYSAIVLAGFFALTAAEKAIFRHLAGLGAHILLQDGPGLEEQFSFLASHFPTSRPPAPISRPPDRRPPTSDSPCPVLRFYKASDMHGEIFKLAEVLDAPRPGDVIVLPEARALFPLVEHVLPKAGDYNISIGYPLSATPVYAMLDALGDLLDRKREAGFFVPDYLKFVFHPYVKNMRFGGSAETGRVVFQTVETRLCARAGKYVKLKEIEGDERLLEEASARLKDYGVQAGPAEIKAHLSSVHGALITPLEEVRDLAGFADVLAGVLSFVSENSTAPLHRYWTPFYERALERILELRGSGLSGESFSGPAGYFKFFKAFMRDASYPFPGTPLKGLQVLGLLETRGLRFDRVYFLDANADVLPAVRKEDSVLSHFVREGLGLSTYRTRERISRYYFSVLLGGASEAHIFYKDSSGQERSPLVEKLVWDLERSGRRPDEGDIHLRMDFSRAEPAAVPKTREMTELLRRMPFSPSALDAYLECGLRFYYKYVLRLEEKRGISEEMERRDIGTLAHAVLAGFFGARIGSPLRISEKDRESALEAAAAVFDEKLKGHGSGFEYLIKRQVERRLLDVLDYHREKLDGITVLECETELSSELMTRFGPVKLRGRADRIDRRGGVTHILDYKTGSRAAAPDWRRFDPEKRAEWPSTLRSVQLPFYLVACADGRGLDPAAGMDASLMLLGRENIEEESLYRERRGKPVDRAAASVHCRTVLRVLLEEVLDEGTPFAPPADDEACRSCRFRTLCGRQWEAA